MRFRGLEGRERDVFICYDEAKKQKEIVGREGGQGKGEVERKGEGKGKGKGKGGGGIEGGVGKEGRLSTRLGYITEHIMHNSKLRHM